LVLILTLVTLFWASGGLAADKVDKVVMASPFSPLVMPMAHIKENHLLSEVADKVELVVWNTPDQLRAMITQGQVDFVSVPSNVAAIFYNKGIKLKMVRVSIWGVFYIIGQDALPGGLNDLKGREIYIPFRGDQPDLIFQTVCRSQGLDPVKDFHIQYVSSPLDITMSLLAGKIKHALMIEPAAAMAILKARQKGMNFKRVVDIQRELGKMAGQEPKFPNAGVVVLPKLLKRPDVIKAFAQAYDAGVSWAKKNPMPAAELAAKHVQGVNAPAFAEALEYTIFESVSGRDSRESLEKMFGWFMKLNPKSVGGKLPDQGFYY
jgi:NitT/TauT family transport system substrate-binding protein